jgi:hypothetical protein
LRIETGGAKEIEEPHHLRAVSFFGLSHARSPGGIKMANQLSVAPAQRDLNWIKQTIQSAIELECSTLPLYLSAMFSLEVQNYTAYHAIRSVIMEEMVHMAIDANMLTALGATPQIKNIQFQFPVQGLPGGAEPDLSIGLAKLSKPQLKNFLRIEMPDFLLKQIGRGENYPTIAVFYDAIRQAIRSNAAAVRAAVQAAGSANHQVGDDIGFTTISATSGTDPVDQLIAGIDEIIGQGEGSSAESLFTGAGSEDEESHYAKFAEIYYEADYQDPQPPIKLTPATEPQFFKGRKIPWPEVVNTLAVPADGYASILALDPSAAAVTVDLSAFDGGYSSILAALDLAWNGPAATSWKTLGGAVHSMVDLRVLSCFNILRHQIPDNIVAQIPQLYPKEIARLRELTDLTKPVFYGPRFLNVNPAS